MKRLAGTALGLFLLLAACDSSGTAPDGSGSARIIDLKTEYTTSANRYVACDEVTNPRPGELGSVTQVVLEFAAAGVQSVEVQLRGVNSSTTDPTFRRAVNVADLGRTASGDYRVVFNADTSVGALLPLGITVQPSSQVRAVKPVSATNVKQGEFYADMRVNTSTSSFNLTSLNLRTIPVYQSCTLAGAQPLGF